MDDDLQIDSDEDLFRNPVYYEPASRNPPPLPHAHLQYRTRLITHNRRGHVEASILLTPRGFDELLG